MIIDAKHMPVDADRRGCSSYVSSGLYHDAVATPFNHYPKRSILLDSEAMLPGRLNDADR
jgi:hypothetical protein